LENLLRDKHGEVERVREERGRLETELGGQLKAARAAGEKTEAACREEGQRSKRLQEELAGVQKQRDEFNGKLTTQQQAAEESKRRSAELENRLRDSIGEAERARAERGRLESELGGQLKAAKAAVEKAEAAGREEGQRSKRLEEELAGVQKQRDEFNGKLAAQQQAAEESKRRSAELENRLREGNEQLEHSRTELERQVADRVRLESELDEQLTAAKAAVQRAEAACRKKPGGPSDLKKN